MTLRASVELRQTRALIAASKNEENEIKLLLFHQNQGMGQEYRKNMEFVTNICILHSQVAAK